MLGFKKIVVTFNISAMLESLNSNGGWKLGGKLGNFST